MIFPVQDVRRRGLDMIDKHLPALPFPVYPAFLVPFTYGVGEAEDCLVYIIWSVLMHREDRVTGFISGSIKVTFLCMTCTCIEDV